MNLPETPEGMHWAVESSPDADYFRILLRKTSYVWGLFKKTETVMSASVFPYGDDTDKLEAEFIKQGNIILREYSRRDERKNVVTKLINGGDSK